MGIKHLKEQNPELNINIIDLISILDTTKTKKVTPFLVNFLKNSDWKNESYWNRYLRESKNSNKLSLYEKFFYVRILEYFFGDNIRDIVEFCNYLDQGLIEKNDISTYQTLDEITEEVNKASTKEMLKKSKKDIKVMYEDDVWFMFKPLSHNSSITYGYNTKWCTAMKYEPEYFYRYSNEGVLIYVINKTTNKKFGCFGGENFDLKFYDESDNQIDSFLMGIPYDIMTKLIDMLEYPKNKNNFYYFNDVEKVESSLHYNNHKIRPLPVENGIRRIIPIPEPVEDNERCETVIRLLNRSNNEIIDDLP